LAHEKIVTTEAKAKEVRGLAEKMITLGKDGSLASRREALAFITEKKIVDKLFAEIAPGYTDRSGGYTRLLKLGPRPGDNAPMVQIELVK
jgi:large subunit ribosomal protein L17